MPRPGETIVAYRPKPGCRLSIILLDWGVRESFHSLHYLNRQSVARDQYELIWLEFYGRKPLKLQEMVFRQGKDTPLIDQWIVAGHGTDTIFNKHRLYNVGLLVSQGHYCVICDSDAIFTPNFVAKLLEGFSQTPSAVLHLDEIRNSDRRFHPFAYPSIAEVLGTGCTNWHGTVTRGLDNSQDMIHEANYGACMAAPRDDLVAIGGADEHLDYLGYICGPYDMTFRLVNHVAGRAAGSRASTSTMSGTPTRAASIPITTARATAAACPCVRYGRAAPVASSRSWKTHGFAAHAKASVSMCTNSCACWPIGRSRSGAWAISLPPSTRRSLWKPSITGSIFSVMAAIGTGSGSRTAISIRKEPAGTACSLMARRRLTSSN